MLPLVATLSAHDGGRGAPLAIALSGAAALAVALTGLRGRAHDRSTPGSPPS
ncbi:hypothetical protein O1L60_41660 [Streptomyces diastatochromogenes]|nr:hypothetical protein [Streptomyces diastatochromogenes]